MHTDGCTERVSPSAVRETFHGLPSSRNTNDRDGVDPYQGRPVLYIQSILKIGELYVFQPIGLTVDKGFARHSLFAFRLNGIQYQQTIASANGGQPIDHKASARVAHKSWVDVRFNDFQAFSVPFINRSRPGLIGIDLIEQGLGWKAEI